MLKITLFSTQTSKLWKYLTKFKSQFSLILQNLLIKFTIVTIIQSHNFSFLILQFPNFFGTISDFFELQKFQTQYESDGKRRKKSISKLPIAD